MHRRDFEHLVQIEMDNEISPEEKSRLHRYIQDHPEAAVYYREMHTAIGLLDKLEEKTPPEHLSRKIFENLNIRSQPIVHPIKQKIWDHSRVRYALSFAAGVLLGIILFSVGKTTLGLNPLSNSNNLKGTMGVFRQENWTKVQNFPVQLPHIEGNLVVNSNQNAVEIIFRPSSSIPATISLLHRHLVFRGALPELSEKITLELHGSMVLGTTAGTGTTRFFFQITDPAQAMLTIKISVATGEIFQKNIRFQ